MDVLPAQRIAGLNGRVSWRTTQTKTINNLTFEIQNVRSLAVISRSIYKPWRITACIQGNWVGRVLAEHDSEADAVNDFAKLIGLMAMGFEQKVQTVILPNGDVAFDLQNGDVISVPTGMGRHYGIVVKEAGLLSVVEYQGNKTSGGGIAQFAGLFVDIAKGTSGTVVKTSFADFEQRVRDAYDGNFDLKKVSYIGERQDAADRALGKLGTQGYHFLRNNCETFAVWAKTGAGRSAQAAAKLEAFIDIAEKAGSICVLLAGLFVFSKYGSTWGLQFHQFLIDWFNICHGPIYPTFIKAALGGLCVSSAVYTVAAKNHPAVCPNQYGEPEI